MLFFNSTLPTKPIQLPGGKLQLRAPVSGDYSGWKQVRESSREFLKPWEPSWPQDDMTRQGFRRRLKRYMREREQKTGETYFLVRKKDELPIGGISISNIRYGVARTCNIGYWMSEKFAARGYMGLCVEVLCDHIFDHLNLHRVEAACLPHNQRSSRLLERAGFVQEGLLRDYLEIDGKRRDHLLYSLLKRDRHDKSDPAKIPEFNRVKQL
ncbi:MAG: GNAT family N-acetyltransferase [Hyphomicrobiales bacterium]|nr:GNAT family N-acetyltransferase [Hyphomicrobiales bacterium]